MSIQQFEGNFIYKHHVRVHFFHTDKWFQVLQFNISRTIHQLFLSNINNLHTANYDQ